MSAEKNDPQLDEILRVLLRAYRALYRVELKTGNYIAYAPAPSTGLLMETGRGGGFFEKARADAAQLSDADERARFLRDFTQEHMLHALRDVASFTMALCRPVDGQPLWFRFTAALTESCESMIVSVSEIDAQTRREAAAVQRLALCDALTGVKNRTAYVEAEAALDRRLAAGDTEPFALVLFDVNELKAVNDSRGHQAGDAHLKAACRTICELFKHSPVYRLGGDEFAAIARGRDLEQAEALLQKLDESNRANAQTGAPVVAHGLARRKDEATLAALFRRADAALYREKQRLKSGEG